jgi:aminoglycoside phosphotransferase (APT) family kinase protein
VANAPDVARLAAALARALPAPVAISELRRLSGGASRETWSFRADCGDGAQRVLVLRRDPSGHRGQSERAAEYALLRAARRGGVPVPEVLLLLDDADDLGRGFVMAHVSGETIPRRILRDDRFAPARSRLAAQCGEIAAHIHALPPATLPPLPHLGAAQQLGEYEALLDGFGEPHPAFELGLRWLRERLPDAPPEPRLVHGDFRNGNLVVDDDGVAAVLDWELAHLGDPTEDLGWLCVKSWRFGVPDQVAGGFGSVSELLDGYERAGGTRPTNDALRFWVGLGTVKWGIICIAQAFTHLHGVVRSVELATLGRRVAEMEWDMLGLLDGGW